MSHFNVKLDNVTLLMVLIFSEIMLSELSFCLNKSELISSLNLGNSGIFPKFHVTMHTTTSEYILIIFF